MCSENSDSNDIMDSMGNNLRPFQRVTSGEENPTEIDVKTRVLVLDRKRLSMFLTRKSESTVKVSPGTLSKVVTGREKENILDKRHPSEGVPESCNGKKEIAEDDPVEWTQVALLPTLKLASCFGLLPVSAKKSRRPHGNRPVTFAFSWSSWRTLATLFLLLCLATIEATALKYMFSGFYYSTKLETVEQTTAGAAFYGCSFLSTLLHLRLATRWSHLCNSWNDAEALLLLNKGECYIGRAFKPRKGGSIRQQRKMGLRDKIFPLSLKGRFARLTAVILTLAIAEHLWHVTVRVLESWNEVITCNIKTVTLQSTVAALILNPSLAVMGNTSTKQTVHDFHRLKDKCLETIFPPDANFALQVLENFSRRSHWFVYELTDYATWKGLALIGISIVATFIWNFTDVFIMILSMALSSRFRQLNTKLSLLQEKEVKPDHWEGLRGQYASLSRLSRTLDDHINGITFFSIASNLYFICIQLLSGIQKSTNKSVEKTAFYFYSFSFMVGRATGVILLASSINQETLNLSKHLHACPHHSYCKEVQRFMTELTTDFVVLSGLNMFSITRNFLLGVAGAVVTYEFVLLQLDIGGHSLG